MAFNYQAIINSINNFAAKYGLTMYAYTPNFKGVIEALDNLQNIQFTVEDGTIVNADVNINAAIDGTKISPDFGNQTLVTTGNVGIGLTNPSTTLHVDGTATVDRIINATTSANPWLKGVNGSGTETSFIKQDGQGYLTKLGIGTASPNRRLVVTGDQNTVAAVKGANNGTSSLFLGDADDEDIGALTYNHIGNHLEFTVNANERMRIDSLGNVGVGISDPTTKMHIEDGYFRVGTSTNTTTTNTLIEGYGYRLNTSFYGLASIKSSYVNTTNTAGLEFYTTNSSTYDERMRIDSSGKVGIGTTSPSKLLEVSDSVTNGPVIRLNNANTSVNSNDEYGRIEWYTNDTSGGGTGISNYIAAHAENAGVLAALTFGVRDGSGVSEAMRIDSSGNVGIGAAATVTSGGTTLQTTGSTFARMLLQSTDASGRKYGWYTDNTGIIGLYDYTATTERLRIDSSGNLLISKSTTSFGTNGTVIGGGGYVAITRTSATPFHVIRNGTDGTLVNFEAQNVVEGTISVSGSTVSYNGAHLSRWSQLSGGAVRTEILRGTVLSNLDEMCEWGDEDNEQLNRMKVSDVEGDRNVAGVFQAWDDDDDTYTNDFYCAMTGDFVIRIAQGTTVARGDLLMSAGDGTAKPQDDDIVRSKTIAKVTSTTVSESYSDGSYCVPCVLMAC